MMSKMHNLRNLLVAMVVIVVLAMPGSAFAAQAAQDAYNTPSGAIQDEVAGANQGGGAGGGGTQPTSSSSLPFTGMDLALLFGAGGLFVAAGIGMRRLARQPDVA
jgi:hypothetical protein